MPQNLKPCFRDRKFIPNPFKVTIHLLALNKVLNYAL